MKNHNGEDLFCMFDRETEEFLFKKLLSHIEEWDNDDKYKDGTTWLGEKIKQAKTEVDI